ncbi:hypothetical protein NU207_002722 [Vibrio parahaemolyticus]|nr:hypothetical protein [Vibrio parahaemolyticus]
MKRVKSRKTRKTHEIVSEVLQPKRFFGSKIEAKQDSFHKFIINSTNDEFERSIDIIIKDNDIFSVFSQSKTEVSDIFKTLIFSENDISSNKSIKLYSAIFSREIEKLVFFDSKRRMIEDHFIKGDYSKVESLLSEINKKLGHSIWAINLQFDLYTAKREYSKIDTFLEHLKSQNDSDLFNDVVRVSGWKLQTVDSRLILESMVRRPNKEFIAGGASNIAAFYSLLCLPTSLYEDVDLLHSINWLQRLPLIDLFDNFCKIIENAIIEKSLDSEDKHVLLSIFDKLNVNVKSIKISRIISALNGNSINDLVSEFDSQIDDYCEGNYNKVIDELESNLSETKNIITKINMYAKSYIYTKRKPNGLPDVFKEVIDGLILIYSLNDANQSTDQLVDLSIKYSSLELSDHVLISIIKSAPYYFSTEIKEKIIEKSKFLNCPLTPLSYNLKTPPSMYVKECSAKLPPHLKLKKEVIDSINSPSVITPNLVDKFYNLSPINKDAIELKVQYLLQNNLKDELISFAATELIHNPSSNVCIPLEEICSDIDRDSIYTIDSVICSFFYNHFSELDGSSLLNEVFEEYFFSLNIERPSEIINADLSNKQVFLLNVISKVDVMDYLGSFDDDSDLKIERINILNKLVSHKYINQSDIDMECKSIVDDIIIESEAAKFNDAKIYVDTRLILNKRRSDIESLMYKYHSHSKDSDENLVILEDMTILKGTKNEALTRLFKVLLIEYMDNKEIGLDKNLSSEIRHGFFSNLMCSNLQKRQLITELDESGSYKSNEYWREYYKIIHKSILDDIDDVLIKFSDDFNSLIESAEQWMKTSLNGDEPNRIFTFNFKTTDFDKVRTVLDNQGTVEQVSNEIFNVFNSKLLACLKKIKIKLNEEFMVEVDRLFSNLIDDISLCKHGTALTDLFDQIKLANTEVKEDIRTVCEWFSIRKNTDVDSFEISKSVQLAERCFHQISNANISVDINIKQNFCVDGSHLYALVLTFINCFNNCFKHSPNNATSIDVLIESNESSSFSINIKNKIENRSKQLLLGGKLDVITRQLIDMNNHDLLVNEGGSGLYKSLHGLKMIDSNYTITPSVFDDYFNVEVKYAK